jgi:glutamine synthetase
MDYKNGKSMQTVEFRSPDGSGMAHLLLAGITLAVEWGLTNEESLKIAEQLYAKGNIASNPELLEKLPSLPRSCYESAKILKEKQDLYLKDNLFTESIIKFVIKMLESEGDKDLFSKLSKMSNVNRSRELREIMHKNIHRN